MATQTETSEQSAPSSRLRSLAGNTSIQVLIAAIAGAIFGLIWSDTGAELKPLADGFISLIRLVIPPIVPTGSSSAAAVWTCSTLCCERPQGALISAVERGSPAERAGLESGDIIVGLNGRAIAQSSQLPVAVATLAPGTKVKLEIWRKKEKRDVSVTLGEMDGPQTAQATDGPADSGRLGLAVRPLTPEEQRELELNGGLLVQDVTGAALEAGVQPGDIVVSANGTPIKSVEQLRKLAAGSKGNIALLVQRGEARIFVPVQLG